MTGGLAPRCQLSERRFLLPAAVNGQRTAGKDLEVPFQWPKGGGKIGIGFLEMQAGRIPIDSLHLLKIPPYCTTLGALRRRPSSPRRHAM